MPALTDLCNYYVDRLVYLYRTKPRARQTIAILVKQAIGDDIARAVNDAFDVDTAIGAQLDIIGKYVGIPRDIGDPVPRPYYGFVDYDSSQPQNLNGFTDYTDAGMNAGGIWYEYSFAGQSNTALTDDGYRLMIKLKIVLNSNDGTLASIQQYLHDFLPGFVTLTDNQDMSLTYSLSQNSPVSANTLKGYLPKPMGVLLNLVTIEATLSPTTMSHTRTTGTGPGVVSTLTACDVTVINGTGPFTYLWSKVSGDDMAISGITTFTGAFSVFINNGETRSAVFHCTVTDSLGLVAVSDTVTVTLRFI